MKLTKDEVKHIARLARLDIPEKKLDYYATELSDVLKYIEKLTDVPTSGIEPRAYATDLTVVLREDAQRSVSEKTRAGTVKALVDCFPFVKNNFAKVKSVFSR